MAIAVLFLAVHWQSTAQAADDDESSASLEEIVVTAARRDQSLQEVPLSVSALSGEFMSNIGAETLEDYYGFVPSVTAGHNAFGERAGQNIIVRGVSNTRITGVDAGSQSATTGFYINDIPVTPIDTDLFDLSRVEVLRGPQGTLYGAASMGGAIKLYTNRADTSEFLGSVEGTAAVVTNGSADGGIRGMLNVPIIDGVLGLRVVGSYRSRSGYIDTNIPSLSNTVPNSSVLLSNPLLPTHQIGNGDTYRKETNSGTATSFRAAVTYTPNDRLLIDLGFLYQDSQVDDLNTYGTAYPRERTREVYMLEPRESSVTSSSMKISYNFDAMTLHSDTGFYKRDYAETIDFTAITYGSYGAGLDYIPALGLLEDTFGIEAFTQEVRLQSNNDGSGNGILSRLNWVLGAFYMEETRHGTQVWHAPGWEAAAPTNPLPVAGDIVFTDEWDPIDESKAVFADVTFDITDDLVIAAGIRSFDLSTEMIRGGIGAGNPDIPERNFTSTGETGTTPRVNVSYNITDDLMAYGGYSEGFRLGGTVAPVDFNVTPECESVINDNNLQQFAGGEYGSDSVGTSELGIKSTLGGGRTTINASIYQTDWTDLQTQVTLSNFPNSTCTRVLTANVGSAKIDGAELEVSSVVTDGLIFRGSLSYTDARIDEPGQGVTVFESGDRLIRTPEWSGSLAADWTTPISVAGGGDFFLRGSVRYMGDRSSVVGEPLDPRQNLDSYSILQIRTGVYLENSGITVTLFGDNLTDEIVELNSMTRFGVPGDIIVNTGQPRTIGITVRKDF
tara:strand:+ start:6596 stop:8950 length:2355 start_codon:yes stop_codon:yes gene_type:complete